MISIVIPTYKEATVIRETLQRAARALASTGEAFELIVVDDSSPDGTADIAESLASELPVRVLRRPSRLGLATAVLDGWAMASGEVWGVMDADLQHPPELLARLVEALRDPQVGLAIGSRYTAGGGLADWSYLRRFISWGATHLAASVLPLALAQVTDPMSGVFLVRKSALENVQLNPLGYKILLEVLAKGRYQKWVEVPFVFEQRSHGSSKLGPRQYLEYLRHLARLSLSTGQFAAWIRYAAVGLTGACINVAMLHFLVTRLGWRILWALPVAIQLALLSNFVWNETLTFRGTMGEVESPGGLFRRLGKYERVCASGALMNAGVTLILTSLGVEIIPASLAGVLAGGAWNFVLNVPSIWRVWASRFSQHLPARPRY
jgi:dolichol-phosphate mannosyltransferase